MSESEDSTVADQFAEVHVNELMNAAYVDENGEFVYLVQLENDGELMEAGDQTEYLVIKTEADGIEEQIQIIEEENTNGIEDHDPDNGTEQITAEENEVEEEEVLGGIEEDNSEYIAIDGDGMDYEQVSAAANLLEFHNQQPINIISTELFDTMAANDHDPCMEYDLDDMKQEVEVEEPEEYVTPFDHVIRINSPGKFGKTYGRNANKVAVTQNGASQNNVKLLPVDQTNKAPLVLPPLRKKRRILFDTMKVISNSEYKQQLLNTSDIVGKLELAPSTRKAMSQLAYGGVGKFFAYPGRKVQSIPLAQLFYSHLTMRVEPQKVETENKQITPLDPDLKTPESSMVLNSVPIHQNSLDSGFQECLEIVVKRTADSFDHMIKGMNANKARKRVKSNVFY